MRADAVPRFATGVRFRFNDRRKTWIVLAPERILLPDETGTAVLREVDGQRTVQSIIGRLYDAFGGPCDEIEGEVRAFLADLVDRGVLAI